VIMRLEGHNESPEMGVSTKIINRKGLTHSRQTCARDAHSHLQVVASQRAGRSAGSIPETLLELDLSGASLGLISPYTQCSVVWGVLPKKQKKVTRTKKTVVAVTRGPRFNPCIPAVFRCLIPVRSMAAYTCTLHLGPKLGEPMSM
jgi:hypothetical protein